MDHEPPEQMSPCLAIGIETLSPEALSTIRVMAFLHPRHLRKSLFEPLYQLFMAKNEELTFDFPTTAAACTSACDELVEASLIQRSKEDKAHSMTPEVQTMVLADTHAAGFISPLFNATVKILTRLWPQMICIPDRTVDEEKLPAATAPETDYGVYLKSRSYEGRRPDFQEWVQYAKANVWGQRDELVHHIARLEYIFYHLNDDMVKLCATTTFAQLLAEASWYFLERLRYYDAEVKIEAALGVLELARGQSFFHHANIYRVHAAIAVERGRIDEAAQYCEIQIGMLGLQWTDQGAALKGSGLLDRAPDSVTLSPWGLDVTPGKFAVRPFRSVCSFGWKLYLSAQDEQEPEYAQCLYQAALCFSTALKDSTSADEGKGNVNLRIGELLYALGNVANKQASFLGEAHFRESLESYEKALLHFQNARPDKFSAAGIAKTRYKLAVHFIRNQSYQGATYHIDEAMQLYASDPVYSPQLARLIFQRSRIQTLTNDPSAKSTLHHASAVYGRISPNHSRFAEELSEADFDELVGIWER